MNYISSHRMLLNIFDITSTFKGVRQSKYVVSTTRYYLCFCSILPIAVLVFCGFATNFPWNGHSILRSSAKKYWSGSFPVKKWCLHASSSCLERLPEIKSDPELESALLFLQVSDQ